jgi:hypothetical protein
MSTIKSSAEHLTLNADGSGKEIKFQCNGTEVAKIDSTGFVGAGVDGIVSTANATAITITSTGNVGIGCDGSNGFKFDIEGLGVNDGRMRISESTAGQPNRGGRIMFYGGETPTLFGQVGMGGNSFGGGTNEMSIRGENAITLGIGGTEKLRIQSGGGISFNGDTAAANALDDYEEGAWIPTLVTGTGCSIGTVYVAKYTKVGNLVTLVSAFQLLAPSSPSNTGIRFGGFPYGFVSGDNGGWPITIHYNYKQTTNLYMDRSGYCYYQNGIVNGNNLENLGNALRSTNYMSINITYMTS